MYELKRKSEEQRLREVQDRLLEMEASFNAREGNRSVDNSKALEKIRQLEEEKEENARRVSSLEQVMEHMTKTVEALKRTSIVFDE